MLVFRIAAFVCLAAWGECAIEVPRTGVLTLPPGTTVLKEPIVVSAGSQDLVIAGAPTGSLLRASPRFKGGALIHILGGTRIAVRNLRLDGNRAALEKPVELPPADVPFSRFTGSNGILAEGVSELAIENVKLTQIAGFAVLVSQAKKVRILRVEVTDSGSRNAKGRNNTSGGILLEEGTEDFQVRQCKLTRVRGNGIWTHSLYTSPRNADGWIEENEIRFTARDAIQVGHATRVRVERNQGEMIGYPGAEVDVENQGWPVGIDTAGNVDASSYALNTFRELNGKCIDLDGFHHGEVRRNRCVNDRPGADYPYGHFGIVMNNTNPDMRSEEIRIIDNELEGMKYGGIFVVGRGHRIEKNRMRFLNQAGCPESKSVACVYKLDEPEMMYSGIYLGKGAERLDPATNISVLDNLVTGNGMKEHCIGYAPGVNPEAQIQERNICLNAVWVKKKKQQ